MSLIDRAKNMIISPAKEFDVINGEQPDTGKIITGYVLPLAGAAAVAAFIGYGLIGVDFGVLKISGTNWGLYYALNILINAVISVFICAFIIDGLAPSFGSEKNMGRSVQLVAYSYTPAWIGGLLSILPSIAFVGSLFALYGLYLLYLGMPKLKKTPEDKHIGYFVVALIITIAVYLVIGAIMSRAIMPAMGLSFPSIKIG
ncbi:MAG: YIP1 family protein [Bacteroidetes bacterium]|nr:YIP1 family protein [Bacteroidota bacterium]MBS1609665.1 YIP1 family protein [Bacteroidota bacterium]